MEKGVAGETVEGNLDELKYHAPPKRPQTTSYHSEKGAKAWLSVYEDRNRKFAMTDWEKEGSK